MASLQFHLCPSLCKQADLQRFSQACFSFSICSKILFSLSPYMCECWEISSFLPLVAFSVHNWDRNFSFRGLVWWHIRAISATWEAVMRGSQFEDSPGKMLVIPHLRCGGSYLSSNYRGMNRWIITVRDWPRRKHMTLSEK
jgi:hypothetical protein